MAAHPHGAGLAAADGRPASGASPGLATGGFDGLLAPFLRLDYFMDESGRRAPCITERQRSQDSGTRWP